MKVTPKNKKELQEQGWTLISMGFSKKEINTYKAGIVSLRDKAFKTKYPLRRCYYPHLTNDNVSAIESPFNKLISNDLVKEFFHRLELGNAIRELMNWNNVYLQLARLFTMRKYKFQGDWHVDFKNWDGDIINMKTIQVAIYLKNQEGFRIIKPNLDLSSNSNNSISHYYPTPYLPLELPQSFFTEIRGEEGSVLFFAPGILHQGNSLDERLDFHLRFANDSGKDNSLNYNFSQAYNTDFIVPYLYTEEFDIDKDRNSCRDEISKFSRFKNSINYYTGLVNMIHHLKYLLINNNSNRIRTPWKVNIFANTIYQNIFK